MDIRQLKYFTSVLEVGSFTKAAGMLRISQPSLGAHVRNLERELGAQLMIRHSRGVEPTEAGAILFDHARRIISDLESVKQAVRDRSGPPSGIVSLGVTPCVDHAFVSDIINACAAQLPGVSVKIVEGYNPSLIETVQAGKLGFALVHYVDEAPPYLCCEKLKNDPVAFAQSAKLGSDTRDTISLCEAIGHPLALPPKPHRLRDRLDAAAQRAGQALDVRFEFQSVGAITEVVASGLAACILPAGALRPKIASGQLHAKALVEPEFQEAISLIYRQRWPLSKAEMAVRGIILRLCDCTQTGRASLPDDADRLSNFPLATSQYEAATGRRAGHDSRRREAMLG